MSENISNTSIAAVDSNEGTSGNIRQNGINDEVTKCCWVCFGTELDDPLAAWVQPCNCIGTIQWFILAMPTEREMLKQGAEARLYTCTYLGKPTLIKERFQKNYRHPDLDTVLTKERIKSEARAIVKCKSANIRTPTIYLVDFDRRSIYMEHFVNSITVKSFIIDKIAPETLVNDGAVERRKCLNNVAGKIGTAVGKMHKNHIIHGDLTTSNMLLALPGNSDNSDWKSYENSELVMIDFGLSHLVSNSEDKGVDLYVLERALISTHNDLPDLFSVILAAYKRENKSNLGQVLEKFEEVRARGRKRTMVG